MIEIEHLTKKYGDHIAVSDLSVQVGSSQIYGFLGPNGAGKTTTMNIMTGCLSATAGHVRIDGYDIFDQPNEAKRRIGYLPEQPPLYVNETPTEYLHFVGEAKGLRGSILAEQIQRVIQQTGITPVQNRRISTLSKGFKQRVGIAQALLGDPAVIILDEPTVGLDPFQIIEIRDLIKELGQAHTVIFSSHILSEVQAICDKVLILAKGKLVAFDEAGALEKRLLSPSALTLVADGSMEVVQDILSQVGQIHDMYLEKTEEGYISAHIETSGEIYTLSRAVFSAFAAGGPDLLELSVKKADLETVFLELTEAGEEGADKA